MRTKFPDSIKTVLITGGAGFIGGALVRRLLKDTSVRIFNLDKMGYASDHKGIDLVLNSFGTEAENRYQLLKVDLANLNRTQEAIKLSNPDMVYHLAAESHVDRSIDGPNEFIRSNIIGTYNLLEASLNHWEKLSSERQDRFRFHHISTDEVFGSLEFNSNKLFTETTPYNPRSPYAASKASSDHLVQAWHHTYGLPVVLTNCSNNFGPWQFPEKLIPVVILKALSNKQIPLYGNGLNVRDWLYVEDHVNALILASTLGIPGTSYCVGGSSEKTNKQLVEMICLLLDEKCPQPYPYKRLIAQVPDRPGHDLRYAINSDRIRNELGWEPIYEFKEALDVTIEWYLRNLEWARNVSDTSKYQGERIGLGK